LLFDSLEWGGQADAACELWQTECLYGTVFSPACRRQAAWMVRSNAAGSPKNIARAIRILPAIGNW